MTINERIRDFRKNVVHMSQSEFAIRLGMKQTSVSTFEKYGATVTDPTIKSICMAFNLNEDWLRNGTGERDCPNSNSELDALTARYGLNEFEHLFLQKYLALSEDERGCVMNFMKSLAEEYSSSAPARQEPT